MARLPNFLIIGAYKSGTTSLHAYLRQHPEVFMPAKKEPNFFAVAGNDVTAASADVTRFSDYTKLFGGARDEHALGEASPLYLQSCSAAERIYRYIPHVKLIAILRQPADAIYSSYWMEVRDGRQRESYATVHRQLVKSFNSGSSDGPFYQRQLQRYFDKFDKNQIRVYLYEELDAAPMRLLRDIFSFLGLDENFTPDLTPKNLGQCPRSYWLHDLYSASLVQAALPKRVLSRLQGWNFVKPPPMRRKHKDELAQIFRADIEKLQKLITRDFERLVGLPEFDPLLLGKVVNHSSGEGVSTLLRMARCIDPRFGAVRLPPGVRPSNTPFYEGFRVPPN